MNNTQLKVFFIWLSIEKNEIGWLYIQGKSPCEVFPNPSLKTEVRNFTNAGL